MIREYSVLLAFALGLAGCTQKPMLAPSGWQLSGAQQEIKSARHWQALAQETAGELIQTLSKGDKALLRSADAAQGTDAQQQCQAGPGSKALPIYIAVADPSVPFMTTFRDLLGKELITRRCTIATHQEGAFVVNTGTKVISFADDPHYRWGTMTGAAMLTYYGSQASKWTDGVSQAIVTALPFAILADTYLALTASPDAEVVITTAVADDTQYLFQKTTVYYTDSADARLYTSSNTSLALVVTHRPDQPDLIGLPQTSPPSSPLPTNRLLSLRLVAAPPGGSQ